MTQIKISDKTLELLTIEKARLRKHIPNCSYDKVIRRLLNNEWIPEDDE